MTKKSHYTFVFSRNGSIWSPCRIWIYHSVDELRLGYTFSPFSNELLNEHYIVPLLIQSRKHNRERLIAVGLIKSTTKRYNIEVNRISLNIWNFEKSLRKFAPITKKSVISRNQPQSHRIKCTMYLKYEERTIIVFEQTDNSFGRNLEGSLAIKHEQLGVIISVKKDYRGPWNTHGLRSIYELKCIFINIK